METKPRADTSPSAKWTARIGWGVLLVLLLACLVGAASFDPQDWPMFVGDEATYLMAAQSLAFDFDLRYEPADLARFVERTGRQPEGLILQSTDQGATLHYSKPALYPLLIAPFVRVAGHRGALVGNVLLLCAALFVTAVVGLRWWGAVAPWYVAILAFVGVTFQQVYWLHADLMMLTFLALALAAFFCVMDPLASDRSASDRSASESWRREWPLAVCGLLVALLVTTRPTYAPVPVVLALLVVRCASPKRWSRLGLLTAGGVLGILITLAGAAFLQQSWNSYATPRASFFGPTGFPGEQSAEQWSSALSERGGDAWTGPEKTLPFGFDWGEFRWNLYYLVMGRHVGLFPYHAGALLLGLLAFGRPRQSGWLWAGFLFVSLAFVLLRPFNFWGGGGALGNRYLLPVLPLLWFAARRRISWIWLVVIVMVSAAFLWPVWTQPRSFLLEEDSTHRFVADSGRYLPYETTQSHLKPSGTEDFILRALPRASTEGPTIWAKALDRGVRPDATDSGVTGLFVEPDGRGHLLVATPQPLGAVEIFVPGVGPAPVARLRLDEPRAHHRMWWSEERWFLYELDLGAGLSEAGIDIPTRVQLRWTRR